MYFFTVYLSIVVRTLLFIQDFTFCISKFTAPLRQILHVKIFSLKQKTNQIFPNTSSYYSDKFGTLFKPGILKTLVYSEHWHIQIQNLAIFRTLAYLELEVYSESWCIQNPEIFRTLVYSETWHIQKPEILRSPAILLTEPNIYDGVLSKTS